MQNGPKNVCNERECENLKRLPANTVLMVGKCTSGRANLISRNVLSACLVTFEEANRDRVLSE